MSSNILQVKKRTVSLSTDKENAKKINSFPSRVHAGDSLTALTGAKKRVPLGNITKNSIIEKRDRHQSIPSEIKKKKIRSASLDRLKLLPEKVTVRQLLDKEDDVFVDGPHHPLTFDNKPQTFEDTLQQIQKKTGQSSRAKPAQKLTLVRKLSKRRKPVEAVLEGCNLYDCELLAINFELTLAKESKFVFRRSFLNKRCHPNRMVTVDWLVYSQQALTLHESCTFIAVRLMDSYILSTQPEADKYFLIGIVCLWISAKFLDTQLITTSKLFGLCDGKFSRQQLRTTEIEVLHVLNFDVNAVEPICFLAIYMKHINLENNAIVYYGALFLLESYMLHTDFSSTPPSFLAGIALYTTLLQMSLDHTQLLEYIETNLPEYFSDFRRVAEHFATIIHTIYQHKLGTEIFNKYSTAQTFNVARQFLD